jgi:PAS domain S-box-containing protein
MGAANVLMTPRKEATKTQLRTSSSASALSSTSTRTATLRLILKTDLARQAFLCYLDEERKKKKKRRIETANNFIKDFLYLENKSLSLSEREKRLSQIGQNSTSFHNFSAFADKIRDDPSLSVAFLERLESLEHYLMVVSVICDLNDFMKSEWHALWQQIEMQSSDPPPHLFPSVCGEISEKFTSYESELQNLLRTLNGASVLDLLVGCLKSLPFPLVTMEMTTERQWFPITTVNTAFEELTGLAEHQVKGLTVHSFLSDPHRHEDSLSVMLTDMLRGKISKTVLPLSRQDGHAATCVIGAIPIVDSNDSITSFLVLFDDISSPDYCLTRLKIFSDLLDSISTDLNHPPAPVADFSSEGMLI